VSEFDFSSKGRGVKRRKGKERKGKERKGKKQTILLAEDKTSDLANQKDKLRDLIIFVVLFLKFG